MSRWAPQWLTPYEVSMRSGTVDPTQVRGGSERARQQQAIQPPCAIPETVRGQRFCYGLCPIVAKYSRPAERAGRSGKNNDGGTAGVGTNLVATSHSSSCGPGTACCCCCCAAPTGASCSSSSTMRGALPTQQRVEGATAALCGRIGREVMVWASKTYRPRLRLGSVFSKSESRATVSNSHCWHRYNGGSRREPLTDRNGAVTFVSDRSRPA